MCIDTSFSYELSIIIVSILSLSFVLLLLLYNRHLLRRPEVQADGRRRLLDEAARRLPRRADELPGLRDGGLSDEGPAGLPRRRRGLQPQRGLPRRGLRRDLERGGPRGDDRPRGRRTSAAGGYNNNHNDNKANTKQYVLLLLLLLLLSLGGRR